MSGNEPPKPPPCRIRYTGMLSTFSGPEDEFEKWKETPRQKLIEKIERGFGIAIPAVFLIALFGAIVEKVLS